jgi:aspartate/tyrosine/aromatic aminotransferase
MGKQYLNLLVAPADEAFRLMAEYDEDLHPNKVSLFPGAYCDKDGRLWVLLSVKEV